MKKALCIGINAYASAPLAGCVNDAFDWAKFLTIRGYASTTLLDSAATKAAIYTGIRTLVQSLQPGDKGVVFFAGHGTWVPDVHGDEVDGRDECLCPYDMSADCLLVDDELAECWIEIKPGAQLVFITDACHSGTVFRFAGGQPGAEPYVSHIRYIPPANIFTDQKDLNNAQIAQRFSPTSLGDQPVKGFIHISGCGDAEYSCDARFNGRPNGAFSHVALDVLNANFTGTYYDLYKAIRERLPSWQYPQSPELNATYVDRDAQAFV